MSDSNPGFDSDQFEFQEEWLSAYLDGELSPEQRSVVESRLQFDSNLQLMLLDLQKVRSLVAGLPAWPTHFGGVQIDSLTNSAGAANALGGQDSDISDFNSATATAVEDGPAPTHEATGDDEVKQFPHQDETEADLNREDLVDENERTIESAPDSEASTQISHSQLAPPPPRDSWNDHLRKRIAKHDAQTRIEGSESTLEAEPTKSASSANESGQPIAPEVMPPGVFEVHPSPAMPTQGEAPPTDSEESSPIANSASLVSRVTSEEKQDELTDAEANQLSTDALAPPSSEALEELETPSSEMPDSAEDHQNDSPAATSASDLEASLEREIEEVPPAEVTETHSPSEHSQAEESPEHDATSELTDEPNISIPQELAADKPQKIPSDKVATQEPTAPNPTSLGEEQEPEAASATDEPVGDGIAEPYSEPLQPHAELIERNAFQEEDVEADERLHEVQDEVLVSSRGDGEQGEVGAGFSWLRPLAFAASLLAMLGIGAYLFRDRVFSLATNLADSSQSTPAGSRAFSLDDATDDQAPNAALIQEEFSDSSPGTGLLRPNARGSSKQLNLNQRSIPGTKVEATESEDDVQLRITDLQPDSDLTVEGMLENLPLAETTAESALSSAPPSRLQYQMGELESAVPSSGLAMNSYSNPPPESSASKPSVPADSFGIGGRGETRLEERGSSQPNEPVQENSAVPPAGGIQSSPSPPTFNINETGVEALLQEFLPRDDIQVLTQAGWSTGEMELGLRRLNRKTVAPQEGQRVPAVAIAGFSVDRRSAIEALASQPDYQMLQRSKLRRNGPASGMETSSSSPAPYLIFTTRKAVKTLVDSGILGVPTQSSEDVFWILDSRSLSKSDDERVVLLLNPE